MQNTHLSAFKSIFKAIKENYPFENNKEFLSFEKKYKKLENKIKKVKNDKEFFGQIEFFLASFKNSHTRLGNYPGKVFFKPKGYQVILVEDKYWLKKNDNILGEILNINGERPQEIVKREMKKISGSTKQYLTQQALKFILTDRFGNYAQLKLKVGNKIISKKLIRQPIKFTLIKNNIEAKILSKNIGYLNIKFWSDRETSNKILDEKIEYFYRQKINSLIIDVRNNNGGDSSIAKNLAGHFFNKKTLFSITKSRKSKKNFNLKKIYNFIEPRQPYLNCPVIILVSSACFSSNEYFIAGMKDNKRAIIIGEKTGGGSGNPIKVCIPFKDSAFEFFVSTWVYYRPNKKKLEGKGIEPDIIVKPTIKGLLRKKDGVLEEAREILIVKKRKNLK